MALPVWALVLGQREEGEEYPIWALTVRSLELGLKEVVVERRILMLVKQVLWEQWRELGLKEVVVELPIWVLVWVSVVLGLREEEGDQQVVVVLLAQARPRPLDQICRLLLMISGRLSAVQQD